MQNYECNTYEINDKMREKMIKNTMTDYIIDFKNLTNSFLLFEELDFFIFQ